jgi:type II secretory pathway component PulC
LFLFGCGGGTNEVSAASNHLVDAGRPVEDAAKEPMKPTQEAALIDASTSTAPGTISRADLNAVLAKGPGQLLGKVETNAVFENKRFLGFQITAFIGEAPKTVDLRVGDVVLAVNGRKIERPEEYFAIFQDLAHASELCFDLMRDGEKRTLRYPIVD